MRCGEIVTYHENETIFLAHIHLSVGSACQNFLCSASPDLPMDFFFDILKIRSMRQKETIEGLKEEIRIKCLAISNEVLRNVIESIVGRYQLCLENEGRQFEHLRV